MRTLVSACPWLVPALQTPTADSTANTFTLNMSTLLSAADASKVQLVRGTIVPVLLRSVDELYASMAAAAINDSERERAAAALLKAARLAVEPLGTDKPGVLGRLRRFVTHGATLTAANFSEQQRADIACG